MCLQSKACRLCKGMVINVEVFSGKAVSAGTAYGKIFFFRARKDDFANECTDDIDSELQLLEKGTQAVHEKLMMRKEIFESEGRTQEAVLTDAHILLLRDFTFQEECKKRILEERASARRAVNEAGMKLCLMFENMEDDFMRERAADIRGVVELLLQVLGGARQVFPRLEEPVILVADELIPEQALCFERSKVLGIIIQSGTYYSHSAILARLWNIPALVGICPDESWAGKQGAVDGENGRFYLEPDGETIESIRRIMADREKDWM